MNPHTYDPNVEKVVPLNSVVLNPASGVVWEFLNAHGHHLPTTNDAYGNGFRLAQEIRKQMPAPRIPEPGMWGVVEASIETHGKERGRFVRDGHQIGHYWECLDWPGTYGWDYLIDPTLVREGVPS